MTHLHAPSTIAGYSSAWSALQAYLALPGSSGAGVILDEWSPLLSDAADNDIYFTGFLCYLHFDRRVKFDTARKYICGIRSVLGSHGVDVDFAALPTLRNFKKAWRREEAKLCVVPPLKTSLSVRDMLRFSSDPSRDKHVRAAIRLGHFTLARISELIGLFWSDVHVEGASVRIFLRSSKTDPFRRGSYLVLKTSDWLQILHILGLSASSLPTSGKIFPSLTRKSVAAVIGHTHSIRRGGAQALWDEGFSIEVIKRRGRWCSNAWMCYIDTSKRDLLLLNNRA